MENKEKELKKVLSFKKLTSSSKVPYKGTGGSAGLDLYANIKEPLVLKPGELITVPTGVAVSLPDKNCVGLVFSRSGLGVKHGVTLSNGVGVIDSDYRGEIFVGLSNVSNKEYEIKKDDRIAQLIVMPILNLELREVDNLEKTNRGDLGFGSTGR